MMTYRQVLVSIEGHSTWRFADQFAVSDHKPITTDEISMECVAGEYQGTTLCRASRHTDTPQIESCNNLDGDIIHLRRNLEFRLVHFPNAVTGTRPE
jgi:hypothetical protein